LHFIKTAERQDCKPQIEVLQAVSRYIQFMDVKVKFLSFNLRFILHKNA